MGRLTPEKTVPWDDQVLVMRVKSNMIGLGNVSFNAYVVVFCMGDMGESVRGCSCSACDE